MRGAPAQVPATLGLLLRGIDARLVRAMAADVAHVGAAGDPHATAARHPRAALRLGGVVAALRREPQDPVQPAEPARTRRIRAGAADHARAERGAAAADGSRATRRARRPADPRPVVLRRGTTRCKGGVVDDLPLSETAPIRAYTDDGRTTSQWLIDAANTSLDALYAAGRLHRRQAADRVALPVAAPRAAARLLRRRASGCTSRRAVRRRAGVAARSDDPFLHVRDNQLASESRYCAALRRRRPRSPAARPSRSHEYISRERSRTLRSTSLPARAARRARAAEATARRRGSSASFADHVDLLRLPARRLAARPRQRPAGADAQPARRRRRAGPARHPPRRATPGSRTCAPRASSSTPVALDRRRSTARSSARRRPAARPRHAPTRATCTRRRSTMRSPPRCCATATSPTPSPANRQTMAVNLTSERVRIALAMIEGIRAGQSLGELLGYQFERGLHDRHDARRGRQVHLQAAQGLPAPRRPARRRRRPTRACSIEAIEARNVDQRARARRAHDGRRSNFDVPVRQGRRACRGATAAEAPRSTPRSTGCCDIHDAVADLALAEGVYQAVLGNYDRVARRYDAYARGNFPPEPDVVRTPLNGIGSDPSRRPAARDGRQLDHLTCARPHDDAARAGGARRSTLARGRPAAAGRGRLRRVVPVGCHWSNGIGGDHARSGRPAAGRPPRTHPRRQRAGDDASSTTASCSLATSISTRGRTCQ